VLAVSLCASADSNDSFSNVSLTGVSGTASGSFSFNSSTDTFSNVSLSISGGVFSGDNASGGKGGGCILGICGFYWQTQLANGDWVVDTILLNLKTGQYQDFGGIYNWKNDGDFNYLSVPEGGAVLSYLTLSGFAMLAGILISGKRRRAMCAAQSN
jgi:hypothetical protein